MNTKRLTEIEFFINKAKEEFTALIKSEDSDKQTDDNAKIMLKTVSKNISLYLDFIESEKFDFQCFIVLECCFLKSDFIFDDEMTDDFLLSYFLKEYNYDLITDNGIVNILDSVLLDIFSNELVEVGLKHNIFTIDNNQVVNLTPEYIN